MANGELSLVLLPLLLATSCWALHSGTASGINRFNYIVQIYDPKFLCSGTLMTANFVLTVAHCFTKHTKVWSLSVRAGQSNLLDHFNEPQVLAIQRHSKYSPRSLRNDIAVVRLKNQMVRGLNVGYMPICKASFKPGKTIQGMVAGWNARNSKQSLSYSKVQLISPGVCRKSFPEMPLGVMCGKSKIEKQTLCFGDSGDPLIYNKQICGLAIGFRRCGRSRHPNLYTDVSKYRKFITQAMGILDKKAKVLASGK